MTPETPVHLAETPLLPILHVPLLARVGNATQFPFSCEFLVKMLKLVDELLTYRHEYFTRRQGSVCLYSNEQLRNIGMSNYTTCFR